MDNANLDKFPEKPLRAFNSIPGTLPPAGSVPVSNPKETDRLLALLKEIRINPTEQINEPPVCLQIVENGQTKNVCTLGNFSLVMGKAKSKKSFYATLIFSVINGYSTEKFTGGLNVKANEGIYFDTEQSRFHVLKLVKRICTLTGKPDPENIHVYPLRKYSPKERLELIECAIYSNPNLGFVVIDGIRDLVTSINDEEQAADITSKLLKWTEERNIHIMVVLHQNKADTNARGHLGTELVNKAETVLSITKNEEDNTLSTVQAEYCRDEDFNPFVFAIIEGLPEIIEGWEKKSKGNKGVNETIKDEKLFNVFKKCFTYKDQFSYSELIRQLKLSYKDLYKRTLGDNHIKEIITHSENQKWIIQDGARKPYKIGEYLVSNDTV